MKKFLMAVIMLLSGINIACAEPEKIYRPA